MTQAASNPTKAAANASALPRRGDAIDQWLAMFVRFLRLPFDQSRAIRDELDSHMRERVRDLMLEGLSEDEGMRRAIDELGEAVELAAHFRAAHKPNRRLAMNIAVIGVAAGAAVISVVALTNSQPPLSKPEVLEYRAIRRADPTAKPQMQDVEPVTKGDPAAPPIGYRAETVANADPRATGGIPVLRDIPIVGRMFVPTSAPANTQPGAGAASLRFDLELTQTTLRDVASMVASKLGKRVVFHANEHFNPDVKIEKIMLVEADVPTAMREINNVLGLSGPDAVDFRIRTDVLEIGPVRDFDRIEQTLIAYDLHDAYACDARTEDLVSTVLQFVESDGWRDNGGDTARLKIVGTKMFVEAPPRYHERVAWILSQFSRKPGKSGDTPVGGGPSSRPGMGSSAAPHGGMNPFGAPGGEGVAPGLPGSGSTAAPQAVNPAMAPGGGSPAAGGPGGVGPAPGGMSTNDPMGTKPAGS